MPTESVHHGTFLPLIAPESVRHATVLQREWYTTCPELPLPLSRERYGMQPIESSESAVAV